MFIRLKQAGSKAGIEVNLIAANIMVFEPVENGGSVVTVTNGQIYQVEESCRTLRSKLSKLTATEVTAED